MRSIITLALLAALALPVRADGPDAAAARALFEKGLADYKSGDFGAAAAKFELAYAKDPDPAYVFNVGQAHRLAKNCARAASAYRKFLHLAPSAANAAEVLIYIRDMDECTPKPVPTGQPPPPPEQPAPPAAAPSYPMTTILSLGFGGFVLIGVGVGFAIEVQATENDRETVCLARNNCTWSDAARERADALDARGRRAALISISSFAIGGAALAGAVTLHLLRKSAPKERAVTVVPAKGGGMITGTWSF